MNLQNLRNDLAGLLAEKGLSQYEFASRNGLSYSSVNKFLNDPDPNPRFSSIQAMSDAIARERGDLPTTNG
jgi:transcriptional regulator with XRE-family HTH domain